MRARRYPAAGAPDAMRCDVGVCGSPVELAALGSAQQGAESAGDLGVKRRLRLDVARVARVPCDWDPRVRARRGAIACAAVRACTNHRQRTSELRSASPSGTNQKSRTWRHGGSSTAARSRHDAST